MWGARKSPGRFHGGARCASEASNLTGSRLVETRSEEASFWGGPFRGGVGLSSRPTNTRHHHQGGALRSIISQKGSAANVYRENEQFIHPPPREDLLCLIPFRYRQCYSSNLHATSRWAAGDDRRSGSEGLAEQRGLGESLNQASKSQSGLGRVASPAHRRALSSSFLGVSEFPPRDLSK